MRDGEKEMLIVDKDALKANLSLLEGMCKITRELANIPDVEDMALINSSNQILSTAHWMVQVSFISVPDPKAPEPMKEIQEE